MLLGSQKPALEGWCMIPHRNVQGGASRHGNLAIVANLLYAAGGIAALDVGCCL